MRNGMSSIYQNKQSDELYYPTLKKYESEINILTMDEPIIQEMQECTFRMIKNLTVLPDYWR